MNNELKRCYVKNYLGGKLLFASVIDSLFFGFAVFIAAELIALKPIRMQSARNLFAFLLSGAALFSLLLVQKFKFTNYIPKLRAQKKDELLSMRLLTAERKQLVSLLNERGFGENTPLILKSRPLDEDDIYYALRKSAKAEGQPVRILSVSAPDEKAKKLMKELGNVEHLLLSNILGDCSFFSVDEADIDSAIISSCRLTKKPAFRLRDAFAFSKAPKYVILALSLYICSFVFPHRVYIRALSSAIFALGAWIFALEKIKKLRS